LLRTIWTCVIHRLARAGVARIEGIAGAPFTIYHDQVSADSDGQVESVLAGPRRPGERDRGPVPRPHTPRRTRASGGVRPRGSARQADGTQTENAIEALFVWAATEQGQPSGGVRSVLIFPNPFVQGTGPDCEFVVPLH
jgi:hypothetical protein